MPLKIGNQDIPRIYAGDKKVKRAYQGNELVYGLYDVHYYDRDNIDTYDPKEYAGGYAPECTTLPVPLNASDYELNGYPTHYGNSSGTNGGYVNNGLTTQKSGSVNKIDLDDKQDFDFYARGRQHKYGYDGTLTYDEYQGVEDPGPTPPGPGPTPGEFNPIPSGVTYNYSTLSSMGYVSDSGVPDGHRYQCTWGTGCRLNVLSGGSITYANTGNWGYYSSGYPTGSEPRLGAVGCGTNHVAVVEYITDSGPLFSHGNMYGHGDELRVGPTSWGSGTFIGYAYPLG